MKYPQLTFLLFFFCLPNNAMALPQKYTVIAQEKVKNFTFQEDQPWANPPKDIPFKEITSNKKVTILHLWATSCRSCIRELKELETFSKKHKHNPIQVITLSLNDPRSGVLRNYFSNNGYRHLKPYHRASSTRPAIKGLPTTLFFNKNGQLIGRIEGPAKWHSDKMTRLINRMLESPYQEPKEKSNIFTRVYKRIQTWFS